MTDLKTVMKQSERLTKLRGGRSIAHALVDMGFIKAEGLGWVKSTRLQEIMDRRLMFFDGERYCFTIHELTNGDGKTQCTFRVPISLVYSFLVGSIDKLEQI